MYRFPDPLDEAALKGLIADKRFQDPRHPEHEFFKNFVAKAFELVHPDAPRDAAGRAVIDPRDPPKPQVVRGGEEFGSGSKDASLPAGTSSNSGRLGTFESLTDAKAAEREERKSGLTDFFPSSDPVGSLRWPVEGRRLRNDGLVQGAFGPNLRAGNRAHEGVDIEAPVGGKVMSPISGRILREFSVYEGTEEMRGVAIVGDDGRVVRVLYVTTGANIQPGKRVEAGAAIGNVQDVAGYHLRRDGTKMTNHVHVEVWKRKDGSANPPKEGFFPKERARDYTARDPWLSLQQPGE